jgi:hypothetical protein
VIFEKGNTKRPGEMALKAGRERLGVAVIA